MSTKTDDAKDIRKKVNLLIQKQGYTDYKWIDPKKIIVSQWVRIKCMFGCGEYGNNASCPPNVPTVAECERFFHEYNEAVIFRFEKKVDKPEDRHKWSKKVNAKLSKLERNIFLSGYERTFLLSQPVSTPFLPAFLLFFFFLPPSFFLPFFLFFPSFPSSLGPTQQPFFLSFLSYFFFPSSAHCPSSRWCRPTASTERTRPSGSPPEPSRSASSPRSSTRET